MNQELIKTGKSTIPANKHKKEKIFPTAELDPFGGKGNGVICNLYFFAQTLKAL